MNHPMMSRKSRWERRARTIALFAGSPRMLLRGLFAIAAMLRAA
jgi:hypothetical protein